MIDLKFFFNNTRDVAMATNLVAKMGQNYLPPCTYRAEVGEDVRVVVSVGPVEFQLNRVNLTFDLLASWSVHAERLLSIRLPTLVLIARVVFLLMCICGQIDTNRYTD